jgi:hypothetical protein
MSGTIGVVSGEMTRFADFSIALTHLAAPPDTSLLWAKGGDIVRNCNQLVKNMHGDWLWMVGDDHIFSPDIVMRLLAHDVDVVVPLCLKRTAPFDPVVYRGMNGDGKYEYADLPETGLEPVFAAGTAGMLVRRHVFDAIDDPAFSREGTQGEDLTFCAKVRDAGYQIWCDIDTPLGHIGLMHVWPEHGEHGWGINLNIGDGQHVPLRRIRQGPSLTAA